MKNFKTIADVKETEMQVEWTAGDAGGARRTLRLEHPLPHAWRLRMSGANGVFDDTGACQILARELNEPLDDPPTAVRMDASRPGEWTFSPVDSPCRVKLKADTGCLTFTGADGKNRFAVDFIGEDKGEVRVSGPLSPSEKLYGGGQRFDAVSRRGKRIEVWAEDKWCQTEGNSYLPVPFTMSNAGYAWLVNRFEGMEIDLDSGRKGGWSLSSLRAPLDVYVFVHDSPGEILASLTRLTGRAPVPPEWAFGMLVSRHGRTGEFSTAAGVHDMVRAMDAAGLPWSGVILEGWPTFDRTRYAELRELVEALHKAEKKVMVYEACGRVRANLCGRSERAEAHCLKMKDGSIDIEESRAFNPADAPDRRTSRWVDITDPESWRWWTEEVWGPLLDEVRIDGAKIDFCEQIPEHEALSPADGRSPAGLHHYYPVKYNTMMHRLFNEKRPEGGVCWSRGGQIGAARYPWPWCGDQLREWRFLGAILKSALSSGLSGLPFMGHDLGGYLPTGNPEANPEPEIFVRGCQLACFHPMMSTHGTVTRPYDFAPEIVALYRLYSRIHYALVPYLMEQARYGCAVGMPMIRHLLLHSPGDPRAEECEDEYLLGEDLLVAPMLCAGETRDVFLPVGEWEDLFDGVRRGGPDTVPDVPAPLGRIPVFVRKPSGSSLLNGIVAGIRTLWREHARLAGEEES